VRFLTLAALTRRWIRSCAAARVAARALAPNANAAATCSPGLLRANPSTWLLMPPYAPRRPFQIERAEDRKRVAFSIHPDDYMRKVRVKRTANLVLFLVDASWSMAVAERMSATKGAILSLLTDAYQRRDRVGLIVFQKDRATLVLPPTNSVCWPSRPWPISRSAARPPFPPACSWLTKCCTVKNCSTLTFLPLLIVLTDGAGNVSTGSPASPG
jgi:Mg-chelatase subunit ChlD